VSSNEPLSANRTRWFWANLIVALCLVPFATYWFQKHLQTYVSEIVLVGGVFTLWALVRLLWGFFENVTDFKAWDQSRRLLSSPGTTRLLVVAAGVLFALWATTSSFYLEYSGAKGGGSEYKVDVVNKGDGTPYLERATIDSVHQVAGRPFLWSKGAVALECRIVEPFQFEPRDCSMSPRESTRIRVPDDFTPKEYHLIRLVPGRALIRVLPEVVDDPVNHYDVELTVGSNTARLEDFRQQTVYLGAVGPEMRYVKNMESQPEYRQFLEAQFLAAKLDAAASTRLAAVYSTTVRDWPDVYVTKGQHIRIAVHKHHVEGGEADPADGGAFSRDYVVTDEKVQTIWLPER